MNVKISVPNFRRMRMEERLFFFSYSIYLVFAMLSTTFFYRYIMEFYKYILVVCIAILLFQEFISRRISKVAFFGAVVSYAAVLLIMIRGTGETQKSFACVFAFALGARNIDFKRIARFTVYITGGMMTITIVSALLGIIPNYLEINPDRHRYYLGYLYSLYGPAYMLNVTMLVIYLRQRSIRLWQLALLLLINYWLFLKTNSRLSFYLSIICLVFALVNKIRKDNFERLKVVPVLLIPAYIVCFFISFWISMYYNPGVTWQRELNSIFGGRLRLGQLSLIRYGVSMLGNSNIEWIGNGLDAFGKRSTETYSYVDSLYLQFLQRYGILFMVLFLLVATAMMIVCYRKHMHLLEIVLASVAFHGIIDNLVLYLHYNTFWLLIGALLFGYIKKETSKETHKIKNECCIDGIIKMRFYMRWHARKLNRRG